MTNPAEVAAMARRARTAPRPAHTTSTPAVPRVTRVGERVVVVLEGGGLVLDLGPAAARQLGRQLLDAGRTEGA